MAIQILDQATINQIAAGEVVERPASVVKELMENAIDAGATAITAEIRDGGIGFIRITDNGCGIPKAEIPMAFLRHSTSKIRTAADLVTVSSLGFRGEALSSIAAVSQVELITKTSDSLTGSRYQIEGGEEKSFEEVGAPDGTTFICRNLFFNTPARRKFLKTAATEGSHVADLVEKIALSHPEISIRLIVNNQTKLHTSGNHNVKDIIYTVYGREIAANLIPVEVEHEFLRMTGFIGKPVIARGNRNFENYFINGRYIKSGLIAKAIEDGYKSFMMQHKYPFTMLHLQIEPEFMDVNVHPSKMELRFKDGETMYRLIYQTITEALSRKELIPKVEIEERQKAGSVGVGKQPEMHKKTELTGQEKQPWKQEQEAKTKYKTDEQKSGYRAPEPFEVKRKMAMGVAELRASYPAYQSGQSAPSCPPEQAVGMQVVSEKPKPKFDAKLKENMQPVPEPQQMSMFSDQFLTEKARFRHRLIGQVFNTYWLVEYNDTLYMIDQHAAHEKVLFEKTFATLKSREYTSQMVSPPIILTLSMQEEELLKRHIDVFTNVGFEIEHFGGNEYAVRAVPDNLLSIAKKELLLEMLDGLSEDCTGTDSDAVYDRIAVISCKAAVKGNQKLSEREANELIGQLLGLENPYTCPHGRPTIVAISKYEMEKKFKRIV